MTAMALSNTPSTNPNSPPPLEGHILNLAKKTRHATLSVIAPKQPYPINNPQKIIALVLHPERIQDIDHRQFLIEKKEEILKTAFQQLITDNKWSLLFSYIELLKSYNWGKTIIETDIKNRLKEMAVNKDTASLSLVHLKQFLDEPWVIDILIILTENNPDLALKEIDTIETKPWLKVIMIKAIAEKVNIFHLHKIMKIIDRNFISNFMDNNIIITIFTIITRRNPHVFLRLLTIEQCKNLPPQKVIDLIKEAGKKAPDEILLDKEKFVAIGGHELIKTINRPKK